MEPERHTAPRVVHGTEDHPESERVTVAPGTRNLVPESRITWTGEVVREWVRATLVRAAANGERYSFDASLVMVPMPTGATTAYAIVIYTPSARLDLAPFGVVKVVGDQPDQETVISAVRAAVAELRDHQSATLRTPIDLTTFKPTP